MQLCLQEAGRSDPRGNDDGFVLRHACDSAGETQPGSQEGARSHHRETERRERQSTRGIKGNDHATTIVDLQKAIEQDFQDSKARDRAILDGVENVSV